MEKKNKNEEKTDETKSKELNPEINNSIKNNNEINIPNPVINENDNITQIKNEEKSDDKNINKEFIANSKSINYHQRK